MKTLNCVLIGLILLLVSSSVAMAGPKAFHGRDWAVAGLVGTLIGLEVMDHHNNNNSYHDGYNYRDDGYSYQRRRSRYVYQDRDNYGCVPEYVYVQQPQPKIIIYVPVETEPENTSYSQPRDNSSLVYKDAVVIQYPVPAAAPAVSPVVQTTTITSKTEVSADAIVIELEAGVRRLYQPKVKGAAAQIQIWSDIEKRWVAIKEYPSLF